jgi:hypothetical protein
MTRIIGFLLGAVLSIASALAAWDTAGIQVNPAASAVLADSGPKAGGAFDALVILGANVAVVATVEWRNAANTANVKSQVIAVGANQVIQLKFPVDLALNERVRVLNNAAVTGSVQASVFTY